MGATVLHEEALFPVRAAGIPVELKNTNRPADPGTWIVAEAPPRAATAASRASPAARASP